MKNKEVKVGLLRYINIIGIIIKNNLILVFNLEMI